MYKLLILLLIPTIVQSEVINYKVEKGDNLSTIIYSSSSAPLLPKVKETAELNSLKDENLILEDEYLKFNLNLMHCNVIIKDNMFSIKKLVVNRVEKDKLCSEIIEESKIFTQFKVGAYQTSFKIGNNKDVLYGHMLTSNGKFAELESEYKGFVIDLKLAQSDIKNDGLAKVTTNQLHYYSLGLALKQESDFYLGVGLQFNNLYRISSDVLYNLYFEKQKELGINLMMGYEGPISILSEVSIRHNLDSGISYSGKIGGSINFKYLSLFSEFEYVNRDNLTSEQDEVSTMVGLGFNF